MPHGAPPPPHGQHPPPPHGAPDDDELSAAVEHMRVGCLELRVWLSASSDHGQLAGKKLDLAEEHLQELRAHEDEEALNAALTAPEPGTDSHREERLARARANKMRGSGGSEGSVDWKQRCEAAEQALSEAQAEIARLRTLLAPVQRDTAPPPPLAAMRAASRETMQLIEGLEAEGKFVEAAELLAEKLEALKRAQDDPGALPHPLPLERILAVSLGAPRHARLTLAASLAHAEQSKDETGEPGKKKLSTSFPPDGTVNELRRQWSDAETAT